jgi:hypothetical protein
MYLTFRTFGSIMDGRLSPDVKPAYESQDVIMDLNSLQTGHSKVKNGMERRFHYKPKDMSVKTAERIENFKPEIFSLLTGTHNLLASQSFLKFRTACPYFPENIAIILSCHSLYSLTDQTLSKIMDNTSNWIISAQLFIYRKEE